MDLMLKNAKVALARAEKGAAMRAAGATWAAIGRELNVSTHRAAQIVLLLEKKRQRVAKLEAPPAFPPFVEPEMPTVRLKVSGRKMTLDDAWTELQKAVKELAVERRAHKELVAKAKVEYRAQYYPPKPEPKVELKVELPPPPPRELTEEEREVERQRQMLRAQDYQRVFGESWQPLVGVGGGN